MKTFVFIRHLTTAWNREGRVQGRTDTELDEGGKQEAVMLAEKLKPLGIRCIVSSDLKRASQTADIIAKTLQVPVILDSWLRECAFGTLEGLTRREAVLKYGDKALDAWEEEFHSYDFCEYGGEGRREVVGRHMIFLNEVPALTPEKTVLVVGHGKGLNSLLASLGHTSTLKRGEYCIIEH